MRHKTEIFETDEIEVPCIQADCERLVFINIAFSPSALVIVT